MADQQRTPEEIEAGVAKTRAEVAQSESQVRLNEALAEKAGSESVAADLEAQVKASVVQNWGIQNRLAQFELEQQEVRIRTWRDEDEFHHVLRFNGPVSSDAVDHAIDTLNRWHRRDPGCDINVIFNSLGGSAIHGMALFDEIMSIRDLDHKVVTHVRGVAASMGGVLLQAGTERVMGPEAYLLIHEVSAIAFGKIGEIEDTTEWLHKMDDRVLGIFSSRSKVSKAFINKNWKRKDWWVDSTDSLKYGFVDRLG